MEEMDNKSADQCDAALGSQILHSADLLSPCHSLEDKAATRP
jgi:hypothetical protein